MRASELPDLATDKHGYVLFDCPDCPRIAKLRLEVIRAYYKPETGMVPIIASAAPNDCKRGVECGFRTKP